MPVRFMGYESLFYQHMMIGKPAAMWRNLPLVIPVLIYNGVEPWNDPTDLGSMISTLDPSAEIYRPQLRFRLIDESSYSREELAALKSPVAELFRIEKSHDWSEIRSSVHRLRRAIPPAEDSLRSAFETWLQKVIGPRFGLPEEPTGTPTLEEFETMLAESIDRWDRELREKGIQQGIQQGIQEGIQKGLQEGIQEGIQKGLQEGEARILLRQLQLKFGPLGSEVEERVRSADADCLLEWGARLLSADTLADIFKS
jgi:hypothetical protein